ncbi:50S ribosomal protein L4 [candidate division FCPU426 bacterium]|nr:50S ribosomal protein L4 [candidate division FCPU426 bacterium]
MPVIKVVNRENQPVGEITLADKIFGAAVNQHLIWEAVQSHLANRRRGTASTKTRGEVSGGGAKPWRQKGTGRARAGSNRSPLWYKGGVVFGPKPRDYTWELPQKMRRVALCSVFSAKVADGQMVVLDELSLPQIKTKDMVRMLNTLKMKGRTTLVMDKQDETVRLSGRNIKSLRILNPQNINTYDVLDCDHLLLTRQAVTQIEERLSK